MRKMILWCLLLSGLSVTSAFADSCIDSAFSQRQRCGREARNENEKTDCKNEYLMAINNCNQQTTDRVMQNIDDTANKMKKDVGNWMDGNSSSSGENTGYKLFDPSK